jgi:uncharacterized protein DUF3551
MRISTIAALWLVAGISGAQAANDGFWCYRDFGKAQSNCSFGTARQCLSIAGVMGGVCERNRQAETIPAPKKPKSRS